MKKFNVCKIKENVANWHSFFIENGLTNEIGDEDKELFLSIITHFSIMIPTHIYGEIGTGRLNIGNDGLTIEIDSIGIIIPIIHKIFSSKKKINNPENFIKFLEKQAQIFDIGQFKNNTDIEAEFCIFVSINYKNEYAHHKLDGSEYVLM